MNTILPRTISNVEGMNPKLIKVWNVLFILWKHGKYEDRVMPTTKELEKLVGLTDKPINDAIKALQKIRVMDDYQQSFPLLRISKKKINGAMTTVYKLAAPEIGELTDPSSFSQEGGGSATMARFHGYITITDEIQKLGLTPNQEIVLAVFGNILEWDEYNWPVYNSATPLHTGWLECMKPEAVARAIRELCKLGYIWHSKDVTRKRPNTTKTTRGWETMTININQKQDNTIEEDTGMDTDKQQAMIEKAMEAGNMELAMKLTDAMTAFLKGETKASVDKPAEQPNKKTRKRDTVEEDCENKYIRVYLTMPKDIAKRSDVRSMIDEIKEGVAYRWFSPDDVEASGFIDGMRDYGVSMSYEVIQETQKVEYEPESLEDVIEASKAESAAIFNNEPEWVDQAMKVIEESGVLNKEQPKPQQPKPSTKEEEAPKEKTKEQLEFEAMVEREKEESRKRAVEEKLDKLECELDEIMKLI